MEDTLLYEKKASTKKVVKGADKKADTQLSEKKSLTKNVKKGNDELAFKKQKFHTIFRKGLNQFEGQSTVTHAWFKLNIYFFKRLIVKVIQNSINNCLKIILKIKIRKCMKCLLCRLINH